MSADSPASPVVLVFVRHYLPAFRAGGPVRTIANMVEALGDEFSFRIIALDHDLGMSEPYPQVCQNTWATVGKAQVMYMSTQQATLKRIIATINQVDPALIYLNSFFDIIFTFNVLLARRLGRIGDRPVLIAPRGEFSDSALRLKKTKKRAYILLSRAISLYSNLYWHASSTLEKSNILQIAPSVQSGKIFTAINIGSRFTNFRPSDRLSPPSDRLKICFLSRIAPMKNLDFALSVLSRVRSEVEFTVYGPIEDSHYWGKCQSAIRSLPGNILVQYKGSLHPDQIMAELSAHDVFFLPTRGENFGHVIHEALNAGLPVLISDRTPWSDIASCGVGWTLPLTDQSAFAAIIEQVAAWPRAQIAAAKLRASQFGAATSASTEAIGVNRDLLTLCINGTTCARKA